MKFSVHKLLKDQAASTMRKVPVRLFKPYALMIAPVYTLLERNEKFVAVKAPLGFFSPRELEKFGGIAEFYLPSFVGRIEPFQKAGEQVERLLGLTEVQKLRTSEGEKESPVPLSPFQLSDAVLQALGPLWGSDQRIEPFFLVFFSEEVCNPLDEKRVADASEADVARFELAVLRASLAVFIALHLGVFNRTLLTRLRDRVFDETAAGAETSRNLQQSDLIVALAHRLLPDGEVTELKPDAFDGSDAVSRKIRARLERVTKEMTAHAPAAASLFGEGGICGRD